MHDMQLHTHVYSTARRTIVQRIKLMSTNTTGVHQNAPPVIHSGVQGPGCQELLKDEGVRDLFDVFKL